MDFIKKINKRLIVKNSILIIIANIAMIIMYINIPSETKHIIRYFIYEISFNECKLYYPKLYIPIYIALKTIPLTIVLIILKKIWDIAHKIKKGNNSSDNTISYIITICSILFINLLFFFAIKNRIDLPKDDLINIQIYSSRIFILLSYIILSIGVLRNWDLVIKKFSSFIYQIKSPYYLAIFRIIFFYFIIDMYTAYLSQSSFWFESTEKEALPFMGWFIHAFDLTFSQYQIICYAGVISAIFIMFGIFTRKMLLIHAVLSFLIIASPNFYGKLSHNQMFIWIPWIMTFSRCSDVLSIDALWKKKQNKAFDISPKSDYGIPIKIIWLHFGIIYFFAGVYKLWDAGIYWALSDSMVNQLFVEWVQHYDWKPAIRIDHYPNLVKLGGLLVILFELAFPFLLFKFRHRIVAILGGLALHKNAGYFMKITFMDLQKMYIFFMNWDWLIHKILILKRKLISNIKQSPKRKSVQEPYFENLLASKNKTAPLFYTKTVLYVGMTIFSLNTICGMFAIHSYPFSAYPSYSDLVPSEIELLHFEGYDAQGKEIDILKEAEAIAFRREHYTVFENNIIFDWKNERSTDQQILGYWKIWYLNVPALQEITHLKVYYHKTPVQPERRQELIINKLIYDGSAE
jgi:hypothetical protein